MNSRIIWLSALLLTVFGLSVQAELVIRTSDAPGPSGDYTTGAADNQLNSQNPNTVYRTSGLGLRHANADRIVMPVLRFDISDYKNQDLTGAYLDLYLGWVSQAAGFTKTFDIWGVKDGPADFWNSNTLSWTTASTPVTSNGVGWFTWNRDGTGYYTNYSPNSQILQYVGTWTLVCPAGGYAWVQSNPAELSLDKFIAGDTNGLITLMFTHPEDGGFWTGFSSAAEPGLVPMLKFPNALPIGASNPQPASDSTVIDLNLPQLCWTNFEVELANVWFGMADANETNYQSLLTPIASISNPQPNQCIAIPAGMLPLTESAAYTWVVEAFTYPASDPNHTGEPNELMGVSIWKFVTSAAPLVLSNPGNQIKWLGDTAVFTAVFQSKTAPASAVWYKENTIDPNFPIAMNPLQTDIDVTVENPADSQWIVALSLSNVKFSDAGRYYCVFGNSYGAVQTTSAELAVYEKQLLAHWAFDGSANDETGNYHGTLMGEPNFVVDEGRYAMAFDGVDDYVVLPAGFADFRSGLTIQVWAKPAAAANWGRFVDLGNGPDAANILFARNGTSTNLTFNAMTGTAITANGVLVLNQWQMFVVTMNEAGAVTIYKNGIPVQTGTVAVPAVVTRTSNFIGESNWTADALYNGLIDDIKIYNYAATADDIAQEYFTAVGNFCRYRPALDYDNNCIVDMGDFASIAAQWMQCGIYPASVCP